MYTVRTRNGIINVTIFTVSSFLSPDTVYGLKMRNSSVQVKISLEELLAIVKTEG